MLLRRQACGARRLLAEPLKPPEGVPEFGKQFIMRLCESVAGHGEVRPAVHETGGRRCDNVIAFYIALRYF